MLDLRQDTYSLEGLTNRAVLLGNVISSTPVQAAIARAGGRAARAAAHRGAADARSCRRPAADADSEKRMSDIVKSTDEYNVSIQANPTVPMLDIYAQTPDAESAANVANATVEELRGLPRPARAVQAARRPKDQIRLVAARARRGHRDQRGRPLAGARSLAFFLTFARLVRDRSSSSPACARAGTWPPSPSRPAAA